MKRIIASLILSLGILTAFAQNDVIISEFMASNDRTLADEDGEFPDWIEIYNAGTNTVDLGGWFLRDRNNSWEFPHTNSLLGQAVLLPPNGFLVVFASGNNRRIPGRPLHTNFRLDADPPEPVSLLRPDLTVASTFNPPVQVQDISYGIPVTQTPVALLSPGAGGRMLVPPNGNLGTDWTAQGFNDASWTAVNNGIGFETEAAGSIASTVLADSVSEFSGTHGLNSWTYGYWNKSTDLDGTYQANTDFIPFPRGTDSTLNNTNYWNGTMWTWPPPADPPWTELNATGGHPSGSGGTANPTHWVVRRYISETDGRVRLSGILACSSLDGTCGDGVIGRIYVDGVQVFERSAFNQSHGYSLVVNVSAGAFIDFVIDPGAEEDNACDATTFTATVRTMGSALVVADSIADWSVSGVQGEKNWFYGYWDAVDDPPPAGYQASNFIVFPSSTGPHSAANFWNGQSWDWFDGDPQWTELGQDYAVPNRIANQTSDKAHEQYAIRRWVSEITGALIIDAHFGKRVVASGGAGAVTVTIRQNGTIRSTASLTGTDFVGVQTNLSLPNVVAGDVIDFTVEPQTDAIGDATFFNATIYGVTTLSNQFASNVSAAMAGVSATAYLRLPFTVSDPTDLSSLKLGMKYDDGFVAYLNGVEVASRNRPVTPEWNSAATAEHPDVEAVQFESFDLSNVRDLLQAGANVLSIHGLNLSAGDGDFLITANLTATRPLINRSQQNYFSLPTPGAANGIGTTNLGPLIVEVEHMPHEPADDEDLIITARVTETYNPVGTVRLFYRVMYRTEVNIQMFDDGLHWDGFAGDGLFGAVIPNTAYTNGEMIRWYVTATDSRNNLTRFPPFLDPLNSEQYHGAVVFNPGLTNPLPVLHWFMQNHTQADSDAGGRGSLYFLGEFYDNVLANLHGQSSRSFPKHSYDFDFTPDRSFRYDPNERRVDDINVLTTYPDKAQMRNMLAYEMHRDSGPRSPHHWVVPVRIQTNTGFFGTWHLVENGDDNFLERIGRDPKGALYKIYADGTAAINSEEKKTRRNEDDSDLRLMIGIVSTNAGFLAGQGVPANLPALRNYVYDNVDVSEVINCDAAMAMTSNHDCCHKNYYLYRDTEGDGEWEMLPWDVDLSFGRNWQGATGGNGCSCYWDDEMYEGNRLFIGENAMIPGFVPRLPETWQMHLRRVRTIMDTMLQAPNTPRQDLKIEKRIDELYWQLAPDAALDLAKWTTWQGSPYGATMASGVTSGPAYQTLTNAIGLMITNYLIPRRQLLFAKSGSVGYANQLPDAQPANIIINIGTIDYNPSSGNQDQEYIQLINTNSIAVDISGWVLTGAVYHVFQGGVVLPTNATRNSSLYLAANKKAFRQRTTAPRGGMALYIEGPYEGQISARGETITLLDGTGRIVSTVATPSNPTPAQVGLRVTEIMYHPTTQPGDLFPVEEYEYIELRNIGGSALNLNGVHFETGIEFTFSNTPPLAAGAYVLIVKNIGAFESRYGVGFNIAGQYIGSLDNGGENIEIQDAAGEKVQDFSYNNSWYPITDGAGASLVIIDDTAHWDSWGLKESWRPSTYDSGTPGQGDTPPIVVAPVVINEVLTHTDFPDLDRIELHNPNSTEVNVGGWFITDDFEEPKKFRIPDGTTIAAGYYVEFDEEDFNFDPLAPTSFAFSSLGDEAYLFSGDGTNITGYFHGFSFGGADTGVSFIRYINSMTNEYFVASSTNTFMDVNAYPKVGPLVISEIMYHPDNSLAEFVEVHNLSTNTVFLYDQNNPDNTWRVRGGVDYDFPANQSLAAGAYALLVSFNTTNTLLLNQFRASYPALSPSIAIYGPYSGQLNNAGDTVRLLKPDAPDLITGEVPYVLVDEIEYDDEQPWPLAAAGLGASLQRRELAHFGNDPVNWAGGISPGDTFGGLPPTITSVSGNQVTVAERTLTLSVSATGTQPMYFRWLHNGTNIGNDASLVLENIRTDQAGFYEVVIYNSAGSAESGKIHVTVQSPPRFLVVPVSQAVTQTVNVTFNSLADSINAPTVSYQWYFNDQPILNATNPSYTVVNARIADDGMYKVGVTDPVDTVYRQARLRILLQPFWVQRLVTQTVPQGSTYVLSVAVTNNATLPLTNRWRRNSANVLTNILNRYTDFFIQTNAQGSARWEVITFNEAMPGGNRSLPEVVVTALPDADADGIPDSWETYYGVTDPGGDADLDLSNNLAEYIAGTDPTNSLSYLKVDALELGAGAIIEFMAVSNRTYTVEFTDLLESGVWNRVGDVYATSNNRPVTVVDPTFTTNRFYRLATPRK